MKTIHDIQTFEDWNQVRCNGEWEVTAHRFSVQIYARSMTFCDLREAGEKGGKGAVYTINFIDNECAFMNMFTEKYGTNSIVTIINALAVVEYVGAYHQQAGDLNGFKVYKESRNVSHYRPSWWSPKGNKVKLLITEGEHTAEITTNESIIIKDSGGKVIQRFKIGDTVEQGSYNMVYTGEIIDIKSKYVTISGCPCGVQNHKYSQFIRRNWDLDLGKIGKHNAEWTD